VANPRVTVEDGIFTYDADAVVLDGAERDRLFARAVEADPGWGEYQAKTTRTIPVVALHLLDGTPNATAWGDGLVQIHAAFRRELALIRQELTAAGSRLGAQLRVNCLTVCEGLHFHHRMEDDQMFASLEEQQPELADALIQLRQEHASIQRLLEELQAVVSVDGQDTATVRAEVERLTTAVEAHLDHEEEHLVPVLNALAAHSAR
jgi:hypothetical protein